MTVDTAGDDWDDFQRQMANINRNIARMAIPPETLKRLNDINKQIIRTAMPPAAMKRLAGINKDIARLVIGPETLRQIAAINRQTILSFSAAVGGSPAFDDLRKSVLATLNQATETGSIDSSSLSRAAKQAQNFRDDLGAEAFDEYAAEGQKRNLLGNASWKSTDTWRDMPQESRAGIEWLLAGVIWFFVLWTVVGIKVEFPIIDRIMVDVGLSAQEIASFAASVRPSTKLAKRYMRSHPIDKRVKRYVQR